MRPGDAAVALRVLRGRSFSHRPIRQFYTGCAATEEYSFLKANVHTRTTYTMPASSWHRIFRHTEQLRAAYPIPEDFLHAIAACLRQELVLKLIALGCDYIPLDAPTTRRAHVCYGKVYKLGVI